MDTVVQAKGLSRSYGSVKALDGVDMEVSRGSILGLLGPNGAGKTTFLRSLLGMAEYSGELSVLGCHPRSDRSRLMEEVCFIADTAVLPRWMKVSQLLDYVAGVHPRFDRAEALAFLHQTDIKPTRRVRELSKGMTVQLHLAIVMAIDARLLVLDEPTLGLDILFRKRFFEQLLAEYADGERTIIISTHQVEEVEDILTDIAFLDRGALVFQRSLAQIREQFVELQAHGDALQRALDIPHLGSRAVPAGRAFIYEGIDRALLASLGEVKTPSLADLFVAMLGRAGGDHGGV